MSAPAAGPSPARDAALARHVDARRGVFYPKADAAVPDAILRSLATRADDPMAAAHARAALGEVVGAQAAAELPLMPAPVGGTFHRVLVAGTPGAPRHVVRLNRLPDAFVDWQMHAEAIAAATLARHALAHARVELVDCTRERVPTDVQVQEFVEGDALSARDADDNAMAPALALLAATLRRVHAIRGNRFGFVDVSAPAETRGVHESWWAYLVTRLDAHVSGLRDAGLVSAQEAERIASLFDAPSPALEAVQPRLLHGDPGNHNVLLREGQVVLVDWEDALLGDPLFDLAFWATFHPERRWPGFFEAYFGAPWRPNAAFWLYFLRIALSKTWHRLRFGYRDVPGRPPASLRIQRALQGLEQTEAVP